MRLNGNDTPQRTGNTAQANAHSATATRANLPVKARTRTRWQALQRVLGFTDLVSGNLGLWAARLALWSAICLILAVATAAWGSSVITGVTGIPGPGFFIFGGLFLFLAPAALALALAVLLQLVLRRNPSPKA